MCGKCKRPCSGLSGAQLKVERSVVFRSRGSRYGPGVDIVRGQHEEPGFYLNMPERLMRVLQLNCMTSFTSFKDHCGSV